MILGRSKTERSWMTSFLGAYLIGVAVFAGGAMVLALSSSTDLLEAVMMVLQRLVTVGVWAGALGAAAGVSVARAWGARRGWFAGSVVCVLAILFFEGIVTLI